MKKFKFSKRSLSRLKGVDPILIAIFVEAIMESPYDFGIPQSGGYRTASEQKLLYESGASQRDGYLKRSYHQEGKAIDIYLWVNGRASWDIDNLEAVSAHILKTAKERYNIKLKWGGDWDQDGIRVDKDLDERFLDGAHFQY